MRDSHQRLSPKDHRCLAAQGMRERERESHHLSTCRDQDSKVYSLQLPFKPEPEKIAAQQAAAGAGALPPGIPPPPSFSGGPPPLPPQGPAPPPQFVPVSPWSCCVVHLALHISLSTKVFHFFPVMASLVVVVVDSFTTCRIHFYIIVMVCCFASWHALSDIHFMSVVCLSSVANCWPCSSVYLLLQNFRPPPPGQAPPPPQFMQQQR